MNTKPLVQNRTYTMGVRFKPNEIVYLRREADERGLRLSDYIRTVLLSSMTHYLKNNA